jgi:hypothetical protein
LQKQVLKHTVEPPVPGTVAQHWGSLLKVVGFASGKAPLGIFACNSFNTKVAAQMQRHTVAFSG